MATLAWASTECFLTWRVRATPAGRLCFQLVPSTPNIDEIGSGLWHTPNVPNGGRVNPPDMTPTGKLANGKKRQVGLENQVRMVERGLWPTPKASPSGPDYARVNRPDSGGDDLATAVARRALWPTPSANEDAAGTIHGKMQFMLTHAAKLSQPEETAQGGQLNPEWVEWLMGYPIGWTDLKASETP